MNLKKDCVLFPNLLIICQTRQLDLNEFFKFENQPFPPSISCGGELYSTKKADLIALIEDKVEVSSIKPQSDFLVVDGSALVFSLYPTEITFGTFAQNTFLKKIEGFSNSHQRVDIVFDQYNPESLKCFTRQQRGEGIQRKVTPSGKLLRDWNTFLRNDANKELFLLLADSIYNIQDGIVYATKISSSICNKIVRDCIPCDQEEADTRIFIHLKHAIEVDMIKSACV